MKFVPLNYREELDKAMQQFLLMTKEEFIDHYNDSYRTKISLPGYIGHLRRIHLDAMHRIFMLEYNDSPFIDDSGKVKLFSFKTAHLTKDHRLICMIMN